MAEPVSPNNFRELDDEFMQKQAKVWLEAVLEERYGDSGSLADLLADGDILFRVSLLLKELIRTSSGGDAAFPRLPLRSDMAHDGKAGGRYLPYSHVDAFLKICKRVGLPDVDLFTPPDVVERKDIRRVCFCIRALSKKARTQNLPVPDFDKVAHTVPMPTDKVGGIREHLQQAAVASYSPEYKSPRPQSIGKVLSSPSLAGSAFLDTPPSVKQEALVRSGASSPIPYSSGDSEVLSEVQDETASLSYEEKQSPGEISETSSQVDEEVGEERYPPGDDEQDSAYHQLVSRSMQVRFVCFRLVSREQKNCVPFVQEQQEEDSVPVRTGAGFLIPFVLGAAALLASVLAITVLRPRRRVTHSGYYIVKEGDTLSKISRSCGKKKWKELVDINPELAGNPDLIYPTDKLKLA